MIQDGNNKETYQKYRQVLKQKKIVMFHRFLQKNPKKVEV